LTILLITHEMNVVRQICHKVAVIESGHIIEQGNVGALASQPHTYLSNALFSQNHVIPISSDATTVILWFSGENADKSVLTSLIVLGTTITIISIISYSAIAGAIGGGGLGDLAIRYGYQRFETDVMIVTVVLLIIIVQGIQLLGNIIARYLRHR
jgi:ABC-type methionine transport system ATPase subunit